MGAKHYKMQLKNHFSNDQIALFTFDEHDGKGYVESAHLSTMDKFTTLYKDQDDLIKAFMYRNKNNGIIINSSIGDINLLSSEVVITHNRTIEKEKDKVKYKEKTVVYDNPLFSAYKDITRVPLTDFSYCDTNSYEFGEFLKLFFRRIRYDESFYYNSRNSDYYSDMFKDSIVGYRENIDFEISKNRLVKQLSGYAMMRHTYKEMIKSDMIHFKK